MKFIKNYSQLELNIWAELFLDIIVSIYFFPKVFIMASKGEFYSDALITVIATTIIISIIYSIIVFGAIRVLVNSDIKDERDINFELKGHQTGHIILLVGIFILVGQIAFNPINSLNITEQTPPLIAMLLLILTLASSTGKSLTQLYNYRKSY